MTTRSDAHDLPSTAASVARARSIVRDVAGALAPSVMDDAELLVSELMSNAVRHGGADIRLTVSSRPGSLTVSVFDAGADLPAIRNGEIDRTVASGRGLRMVQQLADDWGVDVDHGGAGKAVWFRLRVVGSVDENDNRGRPTGYGADHHPAR